MTLPDGLAFGLTDPDDRLGRPADSSTWIVPGTADLRGTAVAWRRGVEDWENPRQLRRGAPDLLLDFIGIATSTNPRRAALAFIRQWGPLELCSRHALPPAHPPRPGEPRDTRRCEPPSSEGVESIDAYVKFARRAGAILRIASDLAAGRLATGTNADWIVLGLQRPPGQETIDSLRDTHDAVPILGADTPVITRRGFAEYWLRLFISDWIELGDVRPEIDMGMGTPIVFGGEGVFAAIATQLLLAATRTNGVVICSSCGATYSPRRRPRAGQARYCDDCRRSGKAGADAARRHRAKTNRVEKLVG
jgi:hypothetical protein